MSYLQNIGLGQTMSPQDVRFGEMVNFIISRRASGKSDDEIFVMLSAPRGLAKTHPCSDSDGRNICSRSEIDAAFANSARVAVEQKKASEERKASSEDGKGATLFSARNLIIAGGGIALFLALKGKR